MRIHTESLISFDHIMYSPIDRCSHHCTGCYLAEKRYSEDTVHSTEILDLVFGKPPKVQCDQFTLALNTLEAHQPLEPALQQRLHELWTWDFDCFYNKSKPKTQICVTVFDLATLGQWSNLLNLSLSQFLSPLYLLSISHPPQDPMARQLLQELCERQDVKLNFNFWATGRPLPHEIMADVDQTYLVLHKPPLGHDPDPQAFVWWRIGYADTLQHKVIPDQCVVDTQAHRADPSHRCGAGISKVQVWADGSVSGCPYDSGGVAEHTRRSSTTYEWLQRFTESQTMDHPMNYCRLGQLFKE